MADTITLHADDDVCILTQPRGAVAVGHKIALRDIPKGSEIRKFGQVIGAATADISAGDHVHSHNCAIVELSQGYEIGVDVEAARASLGAEAVQSFDGYRRADGRAATRNYIALCATVNCSATVIRRAAEEVEKRGLLRDYPNIDGIFAVAHGTGCGMAASGPGWDNLQRVLWGYATHPNVGAAVFVGLGCEVMELAKMRNRYDAGHAPAFHGLTIQDTGGTRATIEAIVEKVAALLPQVNAVKREPIPASDLIVALQCGGSDGYSGITANPALGVAVDRLVAMGGTAVLSETPEIYGAEQLLLRRAVSEEVGAKLIERIKWWESYAAMNGASLDNNPSPGNKAGGLTTILEKSLGAVAKAGSAPLSDVLGYAETISTKGLIFMDTPGYDPVSATGQIAGGAHIVVFTTGRGSAFGSKPAPTIKVATNDRLFERMPDDMDLNCGDIVSRGMSIADKGDEILAAILRAASGEMTKSEALGLGDYECVPWQIGAVM